MLTYMFANFFQRSEVYLKCRMSKIHAIPVFHRQNYDFTSRPILLLMLMNKFCKHVNDRLSIKETLLWYVQLIKYPFQFSLFQFQGKEKQQRWWSHYLILIPCFQKNPAISELQHSAPHLRVSYIPRQNLALVLGKYQV